MTINFNGLPVSLEFNFSNRSSNLGLQVMELMREGKMFALYSDDRTFKIYEPVEMYSIDHHNEVMRYGSIDQFRADLSFDLMIYDYVVDCGPVNKISYSNLKLLQ